jgi:hypothetical protein
MISRIENLDEQINIKNMITNWLGGVELCSVTENDPIYQPIIVSAARLMRNSAFDWSLQNTEQRWLKSTYPAPGIWYGIRFSKTQPLMITFGWVAKYYENSKLQHVFRYARFQHINNRFIYECDGQVYTWDNVLRFMVDTTNRKEKKQFCYFDIQPLNVNQFTQSAIDAIGNYITFYEEEKQKERKGVLDSSDSEESDYTKTHCPHKHPSYSL